MATANRTEIRLDAFIDLETESWTEYVLGGFYDGENFQSYDWNHETELFDRIVSLPAGHCVWSWNGGKYDYLWLLERALAAGLKMSAGFSGSRLSRLEIQGGPVLLDGVSLFPTSLAKGARILPTSTTNEKAETGLPCVCESDEDCGGYCSIRRGMPPRLLAKLESYLRQDCVVGWRIIETVLDALETNGFEVRLTVGSTAWATAREICGVESAKWRAPSLYKQARAGYYGGRVQVFRPRAEAGHRYDINSAYPAALDRLHLPVGDGYRVDPARATKAYANGLEGIYSARVSVPTDSFVPPLPYRAKTRLAYPVGSFFGHWTALELREAEATGATIERITGGLVWLETANIMAPYQKHVWGLRSRAPNKAWRGFWKWYANSLTGKFAQQPEADDIIMHPAETDIKRCPVDFDCRGWCKPTRCCAHQCSGRCRSWRLKDPTGKIWARTTWRIPSSGYVHWAAYLTASARIQLRRQILDGGDGSDVVYCDTDSVYSLNERFADIGDDLGQWGYDGPFADWHCVAPKSYTYQDPRTGEWAVKSKGMSGATMEQIIAMATGQKIDGKEVIVRDERGVMSVKAAMVARGRDHGRLFRRKLLARSSNADLLHYGDRVLRGDGRTYPQHASVFAQ